MYPTTTRPSPSTAPRPPAHPVPHGKSEAGSAATPGPRTAPPEETGEGGEVVGARAESAEGTTSHGPEAARCGDAGEPRTGNGGQRTGTETPR
ncbi:translation initiation factor IF-2, partial [Streptomyces sp. SolWspMP-sol7th]